MGVARFRSGWGAGYWGVELGFHVLPSAGEREMPHRGHFSVLHGSRSDYHGVQSRLKG